MHKDTVQVKIGGRYTSALVDSGAAVTIMSKIFYEKAAFQVKIGGRYTSALVDSGAAVTIMSKIFYEKAAFDDKTLDPPDFPDVTGASGKKLLVFGKKEVEIVINGYKYDYDVHVVDGLHQGLILGVDFLCCNNIELKFSEQNYMQIPEGKERNICLIKTSAGLTRTVDTVVIPKRGEINIIIVSISRRKTGDEVLLEPQQNWAKMHIHAAKCLVKVQNGRSSQERTKGV